MTYRLDPTQPVLESLQLNARSQLDKALNELADGRTHDETAHQVRKRCKKLRGLIRLVRPAFDDYKSENKSFRDTARLFSGVRDLQAMIETYDRLATRYDDVMDRRRTVTVRNAFEKQLVAFGEEQAEGWSEKLDKATQRLQDARSRVDGWELDDDEFDALSDGLVKTYKRAWHALQDAAKKPKGNRLHELRKRVKYHGYHLRLLQDANETIIKGQRRQAKALSDALGDAHDLHVFLKHIGNDRDQFGDPDIVDQVSELAQRRKEELERTALRLGSAVLAEKPKALARRLEIYWQQASRPTLVLA